MIRDFSKVKRIVVKVGTNILHKEGSLDVSYVSVLAEQVATLISKGYQVLIVTSGAIGFGALELGIEDRVTKINMRQACAAIGQPILMHEYKKAFHSHDLKIAQVLLTRDVLNNRESFLNIQNSVETMLKLGVIPIFNENDNISTSEIGPVFGDNDQLSAHIASKMDADLLVILTDIDALYNKNPKTDPDAKAIRLVPKVNNEIMKMAGDKGSNFSTGGMITKLKAVKVAEKAGCQVALAHGREDNVLLRLLEEEVIGTLFLASNRLPSRSRWIINTHPSGTLIVDQGALNALKKRKSLLPSGIKEVHGTFAAGSVVLINDQYKAVTNLSSTEIQKVLGKHSSEIHRILGIHKRDDVARPEDIIEFTETED